MHMDRNTYVYTNAQMCAYTYTYEYKTKKITYTLLRMVDMFGKYEYTVEDRVIDKIYGYKTKVNRNHMIQNTSL